jgi:hypothetical protein
MVINSKVTYNGRNYIIIFVYDSDYCKIKEEGSLSNVELVHLSALQKIG